MTTSAKRRPCQLGSGLFGRLSAFSSPGDLLQCISAYYNGTSLEVDNTLRSANAVRLLGGLDYRRFQGTERLAVILLLESEAWGQFLTKMPRAQRKEHDVRRIARELDKHRREFCDAVRWLCTIKPGSDLGRRFERNLTALGKMGRYPDIDLRSEKFLEYFEEHGLRHVSRQLMLVDGHLSVYTVYAHWVDLFCAFLLFECMGKFPEQMPIRLCRYCGKLFSSTRPSVKFCRGSKCQTKSFWTPERHKDYEFIRRNVRFAEECIRHRSGYSEKDLHNKINKPAFKQRVTAIKRRWAYWSKIVEMIETIERHAPKRDVGTKK